MLALAMRCLTVAPPTERYASSKGATSISEEGPHMRTVLRFAALIIGVIGALDGLVVNVLVSAYHSVARALGGTADPSHGVIGSLFCLLAIVGSILALRT